MALVEHWRCRHLEITASPPEVDAGGEAGRVYKVMVTGSGAKFFYTAKAVKVFLIGEGYDQKEPVFEWLWALEKTDENA
jgi:hypothetical protein